MTVYDVGLSIYFTQDGGAIVNIASISGLRASTLRVAYGTSKAAIIQLTKQQAVELGTVGIRANAVAPGPVDTEMSKLVHSVAIRSDYHDVIPLNRYGSVEEIAASVGFLCSPAASYVNGQVLAVDGEFESAGVVGADRCGKFLEIQTVTSGKSRVLPLPPVFSGRFTVRYLASCG